MADCWRSVPRIDKTIIQQNVLFATSETYFFSTLLVSTRLVWASAQVSRQDCRLAGWIARPTELSQPYDHVRDGDGSFHTAGG